MSFGLCSSREILIKSNDTRFLSLLCYQDHSGLPLIPRMQRSNTIKALLEPTIHDHQLASIFECTHIGIWIALQLKGIRHNFYLPTTQLGVLASFEAEM